ncbi:hypothetical protein DFJ58DRAFT_847300 [Suillus subalutaceus]|uniref:uncharacterized protein n=1 Tax=Suillus subalutaceus TaxID=48586 RepID=UPI001B887062|nr:uncharacterized protein DFJ58DRAFT_847300 [Suillus subalutaceus]KAG1835886.1 hypothetical protein DFJ58DRAFT_847300 [Suillus subalutaceus]
MALFLASPVRYTGSPTSEHNMGSAGSPARQYDIETSSNKCFRHMVVWTPSTADKLLTTYYMQCSMMVDCSGSDRKSCDSLLKIAKSAHLTVCGGRQATQARFEQFMLLLKALSEELEDWKWKEFEVEQALWSLEFHKILLSHVSCMYSSPLAFDFLASQRLVFTWEMMAEALMIDDLRADLLQSDALSLTANQSTSEDPPNAQQSLPSYSLPPLSVSPVVTQATAPGHTAFQWNTHVRSPKYNNITCRSRDESIAVYAGDRLVLAKMKKIERIKRELRICPNLNHASIYDYMHGFDPFVAIVSPWAENGNWSDYLKYEVGFKAPGYSRHIRFKVHLDTPRGLWMVAK